MNIPKALGATALLLAAGSAHPQQTTYTFQSQPFDDVSGTYTAGQNVTGSITLSEFVPPNTTMDVTPILVSYSFTDGTVTLDETNSVSVGPGGISLTTDASGRIQAYGMTFWESPLATTNGEIFTGMDLVFDPGQGAPGCTPSATCQPAFVQINSGDIECTSTNGGVCDLGVPGPSGGNWGSIFGIAKNTGFNPDFDQSIWTGGPPLQPIPALGPVTLVLLMLALLALGVASLRSRMT